MTEQFDLIVIGSGPGGYVAAIRAAQLGMKVACIEKDKTFGGTCLNVGCIPSKALLYSSEQYEKWHLHGKELGINCNGLQINWPQMQKRKEGIVEKLVAGITFLFRQNKVTAIQGQASFLNVNQLVVKTASEEKILEGKRILLATGSEPIPLPFLPFDEKKIISSTGALSLSSIPKKLVMVGAGVIGLELGSVYQRLGTEVTVIEMMDRVCPTLDREISKNLLHIFQSQGIKFHLSSQVVSGEKIEKGVRLKIRNGEGKENNLEGDVILVAIGRRPFTQGLNLSKVGIQMDEKGRIVVNGLFQTSLPHIYAIGDVIDGPMLAHKASEEGIAAVESMAGLVAHVNYMAIPNVMYTAPEVACVGMTEEEAKQAGLQVKIGKCSFKANPRARCISEEEGLVKIIADSTTSRVVGMHIIGPYASEMIGEGVLAIEKQMTVQELAHASHAHPTCSEAIKEAASAAASGVMIH